jgi:hypothetical protein
MILYKYILLVKVICEKYRLKAQGLGASEFFFYYIIQVREFFRRQQFGIYWPDNSHLSIIIKYAKVVILSVV